MSDCESTFHSKSKSEASNRGIKKALKGLALRGESAAAIDSLGLNLRTSNTLKSEGIYYIQQLTDMTRKDLLNIPGIGEYSVRKIEEKLEKGPALTESAAAIDSLGLNLRTSNTLKSEGIYYIQQLTDMTRTDLFNTPGIGKYSIREIEEKLEKGPALTESAAAIDSLGLNLRTSNTLKSEGIYYIQQLTDMTRTDLFNTPGIGKYSIREIEEKLKEKGQALTESVAVVVPVVVHGLLQHIDESGLNLRTSNTLKSEGIYYIQQLTDMTRNDLLNTPGIGKYSVREIEQVLADKGLTLKTRT